MNNLQRIIVACFLALAAFSTRLSAQNIPLTNPGFESSVTSGIPGIFGNWAGDLNASVNAENGISPLSGVGMLSLTKMSPDGLLLGTGADSFQLVDMSPYATSIGAGTFTVTFSASFNRTTSIYDKFELGIRSYSGAVANFPTDGPSHTAIQVTSLFSDSSLATWEQLTVSLILPTNTTYLALHISALSPANILTLPDGHYADAVSLTAVPEPSTYAVFSGLAALGLAIRRRQKVAL